MIWLVAIASWLLGAAFGRATALRQRADVDITASLPVAVLRRSR